MKYLKPTEAKGKSKLPRNLQGLDIIGFHDDSLFLAGVRLDREGYRDIVIIKYSVPDDRIDNVETIKKGGFINTTAEKKDLPEDDNFLYIATEQGHIAIIDMETGKKEYENMVAKRDIIRALAVSDKGNIAYATGMQVNWMPGRFHNYKSEGLSQKDGYISTMAFIDDKLAVFYAFNKGDGLLEILNKDLKLLKRNENIPFRVNGAARVQNRVDDHLYFASTAAQKNYGVFGKVDLNHIKDLDILFKGASITALQLYRDSFVIGNSAGEVFHFQEGADEPDLLVAQNTFSGFFHNPITGLALEDRLYISNSTKQIITRKRKL